MGATLGAYQKKPQNLSEKSPQKIIKPYKQRGVILPKKISGLTTFLIKSAKPKEKPYKLFDGNGLYLFVTPTGGKHWYIKYRFEDKEKKISLGAFPAVSLSLAREKLAEVKEMIVHKTDPMAARKTARTELTEETTNTFKNIINEWYKQQETTWTAGHAQKIRSRIDKDILPFIGERPIKRIKAPDILELLRRVESRGAIETAHRIKTVISQVFRYAIATNRAEADPTINLKGALQPVNEKHYAAITEPNEVGELLRAIDGYQGYFSVKCALQLAPLLFVRPGELRQAEWKDIDLEKCEWSFTVSKTKQPHIVPLSVQAVEILETLYQLTGQGRYLFPSARTTDRPMSNNTINAALRRMGFEKTVMTGHGFRAMARTILDEVLQVRPEYIEHQLGHAVRDPLGRAYNRTSHIEERKKMMQKWSDYLEGLKEGAKIIPIKRFNAM